MVEEVRRVLEKAREEIRAGRSIEAAAIEKQRGAESGEAGSAVAAAA